MATSLETKDRYQKIVKKWHSWVDFMERTSFFETINEHNPFYTKELHICHYSRYENESKL